MITLNPNDLGKIMKTSQENNEKTFEDENTANGVKFIPQFKKRGKSASQRKFLRKQQNVVDEKRVAVKEMIIKERREREVEILKESGEYKEVGYSALDRFTKKKQMN